MNKKAILIPSLIFSAILAAGSLSNALSLYIQANTPVSFNISQEIEYYLKGTFNSWEQSNTYRFVNNTADMSAEANKIKEYKLENIPLNKAVELKIWANNDVWFEDGANDCLYEHSWSNDEAFSANDDHNYIVPMTSNTYSFYLKFYNDGSSKVYITANKDILYFIPSNNWKSDSAAFAIELYDNENALQETITDSVESPTGTFKFVIGNTYPKYKFLRQKSDRSEDWNSSNLLTLGNSDTNNCFSLWDNYFGGSPAIWSGWNADGNAGSWSAM